jgi:enoyl-CoA hydratase/carnithine racemase
MAEFVTLEVSSDGVGTIQLARPPVNALSAQVSREIGESVAEAAGDERVRAVVVWGGKKVFAAGADVKEMAGMDESSIGVYIESFQGVFTQLAQLPKVTIAAINGYALGGGCELALACDFRVCADDSRLGQPEILLGVIPGAGGTQRLPRLVGVARAKELVFSGRMVSADEALRIGLADRVVPSEEVIGAAQELAQHFAAGPPLALSAAKKAIDVGLQGDLDAGLLLERQQFSALFASEDQKAGMQSFIEQGPGKATFTGH